MSNAFCCGCCAGIQQKRAFSISAECYKISDSSGVRKLRSSRQQQPNSIESKPLITYNLNELPQALLPRGIKLIRHPANLGFIFSNN
ncbi:MULTISPECIES: hypothetical protein [unclassified Microcoleus]|uniref:hypothetical protein n=1 Tax=unclassified Microcoleus TaxID=2642155 RepID=UPI002FCEC9FD